MWSGDLRGTSLEAPPRSGQAAGGRTASRGRTMAGPSAQASTVASLVQVPWPWVSAQRRPAEACGKLAGVLRRSRVRPAARSRATTWVPARVGKAVGSASHLPQETAWAGGPMRSGDLRGASLEAPPRRGQTAGGRTASRGRRMAGSSAQASTVASLAPVPWLGVSARRRPAAACGGLAGGLWGLRARSPARGGPAGRVLAHVGGTVGAAPLRPQGAAGAARPMRSDDLCGPTAEAAPLGRGEARARTASVRRTAAGLSLPASTEAKRAAFPWRGASAQRRTSAA